MEKDSSYKFDLDGSNSLKHIRGADKKFKETIRKIKKSPTIEAREGITRNHIDKPKCSCGSMNIVKQDLKSSKKKMEKYYICRCINARAVERDLSSLH